MASITDGQLMNLELFSGQIRSFRVRGDLPHHGAPETRSLLSTHYGTRSFQAVNSNSKGICQSPDESRPAIVLIK